MTMHPAIPAFVEEIKALMHEASRLDLVRTRAALHEALNIARVEMFELPPGPTVVFRIGPVREQPPSQ